MTHDLKPSSTPSSIYVEIQFSLKAIKSGNYVCYVHSLASMCFIKMQSLSTSIWHKLKPTTCCVSLTTLSSAEIGLSTQMTLVGGSTHTLIFLENMREKKLREKNAFKINKLFLCFFKFNSFIFFHFIKIK